MTAARVLLVALVAAFSFAPTADARKAYVTQGGDIAVLETATNAPSFPPGLGGYNARWVVFAPDGRLAYASTGGTAEVIQVVDTARDVVAGTIATGSGTSTQRMALNPAGTRLYVVDSGTSDGVIPIDTATRTVLPKISVNARDVAVSPDGSRLYVADGGANLVHEYDTTTNAPTARSPFSASASSGALGVTPDGATLVTSNNGGGVGDPDVDLFALFSTPPDRRGVVVNGPAPRDIAVSPDGRTAYQARGGGQMFLNVIDLVAGTAPGTVTLDSAPDDLAFGPDGTRVYAPAADAQVKVVDTATNTVVASPDFVTSADDISVSPNQGPTAAFTAAPAPAGQPTRFDAAGSTDETGVARYDWDFGDGATASTTSPVTEHVFPRAGDFDVTLTVVDTEGGSTQDVFTGQQMLTNGSPAARQTQRVTVAAPAAAPVDTLGPTVRVLSPRRNRAYRARKLRRIRGTARDRGVPTTGVKRVRASLVRRGKRCRVLRSGGRLARSKTCRPKLRLRMKGTTTWSRRLQRRLPRGRYTLTVRATDIAGNPGPRKRVRFRVR